MKTQSSLPRREFLKHAAQTAAVVAAGWSVTDIAAAAEAPARSAGPMPVRTLGRTGLKLPILGYGGAALPKVWLNPLSHEDRVALVRHAFARGVHWFDTAGKLVTGDTTYTLEDRALLAGFSARLYETETVKKLRIE